MSTDTRTDTPTTDRPGLTTRARSLANRVPRRQAATVALVVLVLVLAFLAFKPRAPEPVNTPPPATTGAPSQDWREARFAAVETTARDFTRAYLNSYDVTTRERRQALTPLVAETVLDELAESRPPFSVSPIVEVTDMDETRVEGAFTATVRTRLGTKAQQVDWTVVMAPTPAGFRVTAVDVPGWFGVGAQSAPARGATPEPSPTGQPTATGGPSPAPTAPSAEAVAAAQLKAQTDAAGKDREAAKAPAVAWVAQAANEPATGLRVANVTAPGNGTATVTVTLGQSGETWQATTARQADGSHTVTSGTRLR